jgi:hypothetical protein
MKKFLIAAIALAASSAAFAAGDTVTSGTQSQAQQQSTIQNEVILQPGPSTDKITYDGSYTVKSAPTVYAPSLTASMTETCWGSVSAGVSVVGVGVSGGATIKDLDCNKRLNAAVAWRMDRKDIAFNIMCQEDDFRDAAATTDHPCGSKVMAKAENDTTPLIAKQEQKMEYRDPLVRTRLGLPPLAQK